MSKKIIFKVIANAAFALFLAFAAASCASKPEISTKDGVDLKKYAGLWFEIARFENSFQKGVADSRAVYELKGDGRIRVVNSGVGADGKIRSAEGSAYVPDPSQNSKIRVSFFWPFYADYYILELADDYSWSLVGSSDSDYLWILARTKTLPQNVIDKILKLAKKRGYDIERFKYNGAK